MKKSSSRTYVDFRSNDHESRHYSKHLQALHTVQPTIKFHEINQEVETYRNHAEIRRERAAMHQEKERLKAITRENIKMIDRIVQDATKKHKNFNFSLSVGKASSYQA